jgi:hypothetical protein
MLFYPLVLILTPSPARAIHPILFGLQAPIRYGDLDIAPSAAAAKAQTRTQTADGKGKLDEVEPRRSGVQGGDVVRDCAVVE